MRQAADEIRAKQFGPKRLLPKPDETVCKIDRRSSGAFIGIGANIIQCLSVGDYAVVGAGAAVIQDIPEYATAVGVPAKVIKVAQREMAASM